MFIFDVETLGTDSNAVILSMACVKVDLENKPKYQEMIDSAFFVKLDAKDQMSRLHRTTSRSTMEWWAKQCDLVKKKSFVPSPDDVKAEDAIELFRDWIKEKDTNPQDWIFARGNLDQIVLDAMTVSIGAEPIFFFNRWRDVRTAVDFLTGTVNGYCKVPDFDPQAYVRKHDPVHDCAYDGMMLLYGVKE